MMKALKRTLDDTALAKRAFFHAVVAWAFVSATTVQCGGKVIAPRPPPAVIYDGVRYFTPTAGISYGFEQVGGVLVAEDPATDRVLWAIQVYKIHHDFKLEEDVPILAISGAANRLMVFNGEGNRFEIDPHSRSVREVSDISGEYVEYTGPYVTRIRLNPRHEFTAECDSYRGANVGTANGAWTRHGREIVLHTSRSNGRLESYFTSMLLDFRDGRFGLTRREDWSWPQPTNPLTFFRQIDLGSPAARLFRGLPKAASVSDLDRALGSPLAEGRGNPAAYVWRLKDDSDIVAAADAQDRLLWAVRRVQGFDADTLYGNVWFLGGMGMSPADIAFKKALLAEASRDAAALETAMDQAGSVTLYSIGPYPEVNNGKADSSRKALFFDGWANGFPINGDAQLTDSSKIAALAAALRESIDSAQPSGESLCFDPRHAVRFKRGSSEVTALVCFECGACMLTGFTERKTQPFFVLGSDPHARSVWDAVFAGSGLALRR